MSRLDFRDQYGGSRLSSCNQSAYQFTMRKLATYTHWLALSMKQVSAFLSKWLQPDLIDQIYTGKPPFSDLPHSVAVIFNVLFNKQRAPLPPEGTWTYEEHQLWVLVGQSWAENPEERYEIRKIKNFLKDLLCDKILEGPQGVLPSPSPETDIASEAARDLDRVSIRPDGELCGHSTSLVGRTVESRALPLDSITICHQQGFVTPSSTQNLPILESPHSENYGLHTSNRLHKSVLAKTQSHFPLTPPRTPAHASPSKHPFDISTTRKASSSSPLVSGISNSRDQPKKLPIVDGPESTPLHHSISSPVLSSNGCAPSISSAMRSTQSNRRSTSSPSSPLRLPISEDN